ncbi:MAG: endonuclease/exonuclease/phosphatase family protein [Bacteroidota bacterium]|jgi:hypothetical protein
MPLLTSIFELNLTKAMNKKIKSLIIFYSISVFTTDLNCQELDKNKNYNITSVAFYNVENLYDTINQPEVSDEEFTPEGSNRWDGKRYKKKIEQLADVLSQLGSELNPDGAAAIGLCEIENKSVLTDLINSPKLKSRNYQIVHYDGPDQRGVDVALLYQPKYFKLKSSKSITVKLEGEDARPTRDELLVSGDLAGEKINFIVCHWPSRRGGEKISAPKRMAAALTAKQVIDSITQIDPHAKLILMGDLNDDPNSPSIEKGLNTVNEKRKISNGKMYDCMLPLFNDGIGTLSYNDNWNLFDQMIVTPDLVRFDFTSWRAYKAKIFNKPFLVQESGNFKGTPYRTYAGGSYQGGYSDHFPVYLFLVKESVK